MPTLLPVVVDVLPGCYFLRVCVCVDQRVSLLCVKRTQAARLSAVHYRDRAQDITFI